MREAARSSLPSEAHRARILSAAVEIGSTEGPESATVTRVISVSRVSRKTFYDLFEGRSDCLRAAVEDAMERASERAIGAYEPRARWAERLRAGLDALLKFIDEEPAVARLCLRFMLGDPATLNGRRGTLDQLTR